MKSSFVFPLIAVAVLAGCSQKAAAPAAGGTDAVTGKPVATVNGEPISRDTFEYASKNLAGKPSTELTPEQRNELLDSLIAATAISQQAAKDGLDKKGEAAASLAISRLQLLQQAAGENYLKDKASTDAELKAEYDTQVGQMPKSQYKAHHILVKTEDEAKAAIARIKKGEKFEAVAKAVSLDSSGRNGGDLGDFFNAGSMVPPFANAVMALKKGEMTQTPVQTQYGWHVIRLDDTRENAAPPFDSVKDRVDQVVKTKKFKAYSDGLVKAAKVEKSL
jgi:peptidyl-prolyl cis-trans isomerase C